MASNLAMAVSCHIHIFLPLWGYFLEKDANLEASNLAMAVSCHIHIFLPLWGYFLEKDANLEGKVLLFIIRFFLLFS